MQSSVHVCRRCHFANAPKAKTCRACGTRLVALPAPAPPPIWVTTEDFRRLRKLAVRNLRGAPELCDILLREINHAIICRSEWIPANVVTMDSRVEYKARDGAAAEIRTLVFPDRYDPAEQTVSVLSPLGAALIGLAEGSSLGYRDRYGKSRSVRVERVLYQPEADRRAARPGNELEVAQ